MSFYSRLHMVLSEHKLKTSDFPVEIQNTRRRKFVIITPEEFPLKGTVHILRTKVEVKINHDKLPKT